MSKELMLPEEEFLRRITKARQLMAKAEIDAILAVINRTGARIHGSGGLRGKLDAVIDRTGVTSGRLRAMLDALREAHDAGKGIYAMKVLGRGILAKDVESALGYVLRLPCVHAASVGMKTFEELDQNVEITNRLSL